MRCLSLALVLAAACSAAGADPSASRAGLTTRALAPREVDVSDVAILFPLPKAGSTSGLIPGSRVVPAAVLGALGTLVSGEPDADMHAALRVVAVRLEPCFLSAPAAGGVCARQVRFVLQPVVADPSGREATTTLDAAVHAIYDLSDDAFEALLSTITTARGAAGSVATLGVHPVLAAEGLDGLFAQKLTAALTRAADGGQLARVTFLGLRGRGNEWQLGGVNVAADGSTSPLSIPGSGAKLQSIVVQRGGESFSKFLSPATAGGDDVSLLMDSAAAAGAPREQLTAALRAANRIENPDLRSSEDTDCATCHTVASSRFWAEAKLGVREGADRYAAPESPPPAALLADSGVLRALGYFGAEAVVSPRAQNDTAKAALTIRSGSPREITR